MTVLTLESFVTELLFAEAKTVLAIHEGIEGAAIVIEKAAKAQIGHYLDHDVGPFSEWEDLKDSTVEDKERQGYAPPDNPLLREGDLRDSITHETHGLEAIIGSKSKIAAYQEFGTEHIPPRPFIGPAAVESEHKIEELIGAAMVIGICGHGAIPSGLYDFKIEKA